MVRKRKRWVLNSLDIGLRPFCFKKGILLLFLPIVFLSNAISQATPLSPAESNRESDHSSLRIRVKKSQKILKALFLEHRHRYFEAKKIWETLPQTSKSVKDHIFQADLMNQTQLVLETIPPTASSIMLAVSYLNWQKQWDEAYRLLKKHPALVPQNEDLRLMEVRQSLYLRKYKEAESLLLKISPLDSYNKIQRGILWSWTHALSEKKSELKAVIEELEEMTLYLPASFFLTENGTFTWPELKKRVLKALTLSPSDTELFEKVIVLFQSNGDWKELENLIQWTIKKRRLKAIWKLEANVYWRTHQKEELKRLLGTVSEDEKKRVEYLDYAARLAILEEEWEQLKRISDQFRKDFSFLRDGDLFLAEYQKKQKRLGRE